MTKLTHISEDGSAEMVDVGSKTMSPRRAIAMGEIIMSDAALLAIRKGNAPKGDVLGTARIAGILAAKKTAELIPLCHPLGLDKISIDFAFLSDGIEVIATVAITGKTGVEMEALTAVTIALLTLYDMTKAIDKGMVIGEIKLIEKLGGKSGSWRLEQQNNR